MTLWYHAENLGDLKINKIKGEIHAKALRFYGFYYSRNQIYLTIRETYFFMVTCKLRT
jgi:hypothetical protein